VIVLLRLLVLARVIYVAKPAF